MSEKFIFHHIGIYTLDVKKSIDFYTSFFGFNLIEKVQEKNYNGEVEKEIVVLGKGDIIIELIYKGNYKELGNQDTIHLAFETKSLDSTVRELANSGINIEKKNILQIKNLFNSKNIDILFLIGPNGEKIELLERKMNNY